MLVQEITTLPYIFLKFPWFSCTGGTNSLNLKSKIYYQNLFKDRILDFVTDVKAISVAVFCEEKIQNSTFKAKFGLIKKNVNEI